MVRKKLTGVLCYIGIGSNMGDAAQNCRDAVKRLSLTKEITVTKVSSLYETEPVGIEKQNWFVNAVAEIRTVLAARDLLKILQDVEKAMGRKRNIKGGPRIIDLDLLFYDQEVIDEQDLIVPHPEVSRRRFVLEPLGEIASFYIHPVFGVSIRGLKDRLEDRKIVRLIN